MEPTTQVPNDLPTDPVPDGDVIDSPVPDADEENDDDAEGTEIPE